MTKSQTHLILGVGEIGGAYYRLMKPHYKVFRLDVDPERSDGRRIPGKVDVLHVCLQYSERFESIVYRAIARYKPDLINNMTTCPPGTTERLDPANACHSTTRGLHPNLDEWIRQGIKHVGGPRAADVAAIFDGSVCWEPCITHPIAKTTELAHLLSNFILAAELMAADEGEKLCRAYGVDYYEAVMRYSETHNQGYAALGFKTKFRPVLSPPWGKIGGHCVGLAPKLIPAELQGPIMRRLGEYGR